MILYYFLSGLLYIGPMLATLTLSMSLLYGVFKQFHADLERHFGTPCSYAA